MIRRITASKLDKRQPGSDWARPSLPPARRTTSRRGQKVGGTAGLRYRAGFRPSDHPAQSARRVLDRATKHQEPDWEVVDDFHADIAVLPAELRVIETYLAALLDESFEQMGLGTDKVATETGNCDVE